LKTRAATGRGGLVVGFAGPLRLVPGLKTLGCSLLGQKGAWGATWRSESAPDRFSVRVSGVRARSYPRSTRITCFSGNTSGRSKIRGPIGGGSAPTRPGGAGFEPRDQATGLPRRGPAPTSPRRCLFSTPEPARGPQSPRPQTHFAPSMPVFHSGAGQRAAITRPQTHFAPSMPVLNHGTKPQGSPDRTQHQLRPVDAGFQPRNHSERPADLRRPPLPAAQAAAL
jgi:hypothetical protein